MCEYMYGCMGLVLAVMSVSAGSRSSVENFVQRVSTGGVASERTVDYRNIFCGMLGGGGKVGVALSK